MSPPPLRVLEAPGDGAYVPWFASLTTRYMPASRKLDSMWGISAMILREERGSRGEGGRGVCAQRQFAGSVAGETKDARHQGICGEAASRNCRFGSEEEAGVPG